MPCKIIKLKSNIICVPCYGDTNYQTRMFKVMTNIGLTPCITNLNIIQLDAQHIMSLPAYRKLLASKELFERFFSLDELPEYVREKETEQYSYYGAEQNKDNNIEDELAICYLEMGKATIYCRVKVVDSNLIVSDFRSNTPNYDHSLYPLMLIEVLERANDRGINVNRVYLQATDNEREAIKRYFEIPNEQTRVVVYATRLIHEGVAEEIIQLLKKELEDTACGISDRMASAVMHIDNFEGIDEFIKYIGRFALAPHSVQKRYYKAIKFLSDITGNMSNKDYIGYCYFGSGYYGKRKSIVDSFESEEFKTAIKNQCTKKKDEKKIKNELADIHFAKINIETKLCRDILRVAFGWYIEHIVASVVGAFSQDNRLLGFAVIRREESLNMMMLQRLYVAPEYRGYGLGRTIISYVFSLSDNEGCDYIMVKDIGSAESLDMLQEKLNDIRSVEKAYDGTFIFTNFGNLKKSELYQKTMSGEAADVLIVDDSMEKMVKDKLRENKFLPDETFDPRFTSFKYNAKEDMLEGAIFATQVSSSLLYIRDYFTPPERERVLCVDLLKKTLTEACEYFRDKDYVVFQVFDKEKSEILTSMLQDTVAESVREILVPRKEAMLEITDTLKTLETITDYDISTMLDNSVGRNEINKSENETVEKVNKLSFELTAYGLGHKTVYYMRSKTRG